MDPAIPDPCNAQNPQGRSTQRSARAHLPLVAATAVLFLVSRGSRGGGNGGGNGNSICRAAL